MAALLLAVALFIGWWFALKKGLVPAVLSKYYLTFSVFCLVCTSGFVTFLIDLFRRFGIVKRHITNEWCSFACSYIFYFMFLCNPQIRVHIDESELKWSSIPNRICLLANHASFLDALIVTAFSPVKFIINSRTLMKSSLRNLPIFGGVFDRVGHFPVYFKATEGSSFSVDKEKQAKVNEHVIAHIQRDGRLTIFPEGQMNRNPAELLPFRNGTFQTVLQNKMEIFYCVMWGNDKVWPASSPITNGGSFDIYVKVGRIGFASEDEDNAALSARCQVFIQKAVNDLAAHAIREQVKHKY
eukprot:GILI01027304.1.p1 GENE.GILI01027304.1~~GILI01027304.1.p1  ORF type:complete len:322 (+),score=35.67 GILI01027304.1:73-966(+)